MKLIGLIMLVPFYLQSQVSLVVSKVNSEKSGIQWVKGFTWEEIKGIAKRENKYIFLDVYATWCLPCKQMDKVVFQNDSVCEVVNDRFISVKVQTDKTKLDNEEIKKWYADAQVIARNYSVTSLPTYLFFAPDGKPVHKVIGYKPANDFLVEVGNVFNPKKQYYKILSDFKPGEMDTAEMKNLARSFKDSDKELSSNIAADYLSRIPSSLLSDEDNVLFMLQFCNNRKVKEIARKYLNESAIPALYKKHNLMLVKYLSNDSVIQKLILGRLEHLDKAELGKKENLTLLTLFNRNQNWAKRIAADYIGKLNSTEILTEPNLNLLRNYTTGSNDMGFNIFYKNANSIDSVLGKKMFARNFVDNIIVSEEIKPAWDSLKKTDAEPDWDRMAQVISNKYGSSYAERNILFARTKFYEYKAKHSNTNWAEYIKYGIQYYSNVPVGNDTVLADLNINNFNYEAVFFHSDERKQISSAISIQKKVVDRNLKTGFYTYIDTYANLLYKSGKVSTAIQWEQKALEMAKEAKDEFSIKEYSLIIEKMKKKEPTWVK